MEEMLARHRKEKKDLQGKVTQKKKNATKKTRKGVNDECERLERELAEQQHAELEALAPAENDPDDLEGAVEDLTLNGINEDDQDNSRTPSITGESLANGDIPPASHQHPRKPNRQKARLARRAAEHESLAQAAAQEASNLPDRREQELTSMRSHLKKLNLQETLIRPDGHCLFSACAHGMSPAGLVLFDSTDGNDKKQPYQHVRYAAANFMQKHPEDFEPFLEDPLVEHVRKIRDTAEWGGQTELLAIARSYKRNINVLRANGQVDKVSAGGDGGEKSDEEPIWLAYYEHSFGLGEHYNALKKTDQG